MLYTQNIVIFLYILENGKNYNNEKYENPYV